MAMCLASQATPVGHLVDSAEGLQDLNEYDLIESLVSQHRYQKALIERVSDLMAGSGYHEILGYFLAGADGELALRMRATPELFDSVAAVKALDAEYWNRALSLTDVRVFTLFKRTGSCSPSLSIIDRTSAYRCDSPSQHACVGRTYFLAGSTNGRRYMKESSRAQVLR